MVPRSPLGRALVALGCRASSKRCFRPDRFAQLHYGLAAILTFVGVKLLLQGFGVHIPIFASPYATRGGKVGGEKS